MRAIILAGGKGSRLKPYTTLIPKPLVPIGGEKAIIEIIIQQLVAAGFTHITLAVNHFAKLIMSYIGDGSQWGIKIDYSLENMPLSTIGPIKLIDELPENFLVMNGDVLSDIDYRAIYLNHLEFKPPVTVATYRRTQKVDFGVLRKNSENVITSFEEKPSTDYHVSMGVYVLNKSVLNNFAKGELYGFDHLMLDCIKNNAQARSFDWKGFWLDIGRPEDYDYCNENYGEICKMLSI